MDQGLCLCCLCYQVLLYSSYYRAMILKWKKADLQDALICSSIDSDESNSTPIFRAVFDGLITHKYIQGENPDAKFCMLYNVNFSE